MFLLRLSTLLFLYIPQFSARCREYVGEIYELDYYFSISFFSFFSIFQYNIPTTIDVAYLSFYQNIFI
jgi:hypothetical protein